MALELTELMARHAAIDIEALAALATPVTADSKPYFWHTQEAFPYFTNRLGPYSVGFDSEDTDTIQIDVLKRLVIAHLTSGYIVENDAKLTAWVAQVIEYYNEREWLQSAAYPDELRYLIRARIVSGTGYTIFANSGIGQTIQVGTEFTVRCEFMHDILQID